MSLTHTGTSITIVRGPNGYGFNLSRIGGYHVFRFVDESGPAFNAGARVGDSIIQVCVACAAKREGEMGGGLHACMRVWDAHGIVTTFLPSLKPQRINCTSGVASSTYFGVTFAPFCMERGGICRSCMFA